MSDRHGIQAAVDAEPKLRERIRVLEAALADAVDSIEGAMLVTALISNESETGDPHALCREAEPLFRADRDRIASVLRG